MSAQRAPMRPPALPGFTYLDVLGSGGFADVYLYEQQLPKRRVAVKVLLTERMSSGSVAEFTAEANVMAMLSTHPAIVTIYQAGVADDGRPYLVMEYCPKPNLQARYRREPFSVAESLRVGVQVAAAVETAHRAGVLHRDIKPANILVTEYNRPALTDFGIASTTAAAADSQGLSIPWSPPESFADVPRSDPRSDVWALGATVYSLLAGRSPFETPGGRNTAADLIDRIERGPLPPLGRADVPAALEATLERAMAKSPADRYDTAIAFARSLQKVQIELSHSVTAIDILDDGLPEDEVDDEDDGLTRVRGIVSIDPETAPAAGPTRPSFVAPVTDTGVDATVVRDSRDRTARREIPTFGTADFETVVRADAVSSETDAGHTVLRAPAPRVAPTPPVVAGAEPTDAAPAPETTGATGPTDSPRTRTPRWLWFAAAAAVVVVAVVVAVSLPGILSPDTGATPAPTTAAPQDPVVLSVPSPEDLAGSASGDRVVFTWNNPSPQDGDRYLWGVVTRADEDPDLQPVSEASVTVPADPSGSTCIEVRTVREGGQASDPVRGCAP
ncbi:serine/threonine-protein kinase [Microbacterium sp. ARD31]|uniref:serine/threonine-protein kinase n=1 Tax=Microbacterium sp. ARD31 TaxID=2962576 RepID=UPI002882C2AC|nr:serine/threonine-protein kinase [Microbacterium sp. ARD31]MDT0182715.1 serine/threonine-protein kinase [Microbacterium sp. ARD31]